MGYHVVRVDADVVRRHPAHAAAIVEAALARR